MGEGQRGAANAAANVRENAEADWTYFLFSNCAHSKQIYGHLRKLNHYAIGGKILHI